MFISFIFCLFFRIYNNNNFLEELICNIQTRKNIKHYSKVFNLKTILCTDNLILLDNIYCKNNNINVILENIKCLLINISNKYYYGLVSNNMVTDLLENLQLCITMLYGDIDQKVIFHFITSFIIILFCIDYKHISRHNIDIKILNNIFNIDNFFFIVHYYKGIGGDESAFFIRDYDMAIDKVLKHLLFMNVIKTISNESYYRKYSILLKNISFNSFILFAMMSHEGPVVRVQREPENDSKKIHTSTIGVLFVNIPLVNNIEKPLSALMDSQYIKVDIFRASGAGGQHVNKTSSAVRVTHSLFEISCVSQNSRSQLANKKDALLRLQEKISRDFSDGVALLLNSHFMKLDRNAKSQTFNYKRNMIHFHNDFIKDSINIVIDAFRDYTYFVKVFNKFINLL